MSALDELFSDSPKTTTGPSYFSLTDVVPLSGGYGRYVKLRCVDDTDLQIEATADERHFHLLEPYVEQLRASRENQDSDYPVVPVFKGADGRWRFSWLAAERDNPELVKGAHNYAPENADRAYRMQVSVPGTLASQFKAVAAARGMTHTDYLLVLIRDAVS